MAQISSSVNEAWFGEPRARLGKLNNGLPMTIIGGLVAAFAARLAGLEVLLLIVGSLLALFGLALGLVTMLRRSNSRSAMAEVAGGAAFLGFACALLST